MILFLIVISKVGFFWMWRIVDRIEKYYRFSNIAVQPMENEVQIALLPV